jgi:ATP-dependent Clp protease ATP-binding subunit ClpA
MERAIERELETPFTEAILNQEIKKGSVVLIDKIDGSERLSFTIKN